MAPPCALNCFSEGKQHWIPAKRWSCRKLVFFMPIAIDKNGCIQAKIVDPVYPFELGACRKQRVPIILQDDMVIEGTSIPKLEQGRVYSIFGCGSPVSRVDGWHVQSPKQGAHTGFAQILEWEKTPCPLPIEGVSTAASDEHYIAEAHVGVREWSPALGCPGPQVLEGSPALHAQDGANGTRNCRWGAFHTARGSNNAGNMTPVSSAIRLPRPPTGLFDLNGKFHSMSLPMPGQTWPQWIADICPVHPHCLQATIDGEVVPHDSPLPSHGFLLRLRGLLPGGTKDRTKLIQHLQARGVPQSCVEARADEVLACIGQDGLHEAYKSLEPWNKLKALVQNRMRLILPAELREAKIKSRGHPKGEDPWLKSDPWSEAASSHEKGPQNAQLESALTPGSFVDGAQNPVPVLAALCAGGHGIALSSMQETEAFAASGGTSDDGLAAVVLSPVRPSVTQHKVEQVTFPATANDQRILLRGWLVQFGGSKISVGQAKHQVTAEDQGVVVIACEARREYISDWEEFAGNCMRYIHSNVEGLQGAISSWSKRWYKDNKQVPPCEAQTWHGFFKLPRDALAAVLPQSGKAGLFFVPKDGAEAGRFRVVWLQTTELQRAMTMMRAYPSAQGVVRGRNSLGIRVKASDYSATRQKLEPAWDPSGVKTDIPILARWSLAPIPSSMDKPSVQKILNAMNWEATPLRQLSYNQWLIGSASVDPPPNDTIEVNGCLALISPAQPERTTAPPETLVAGPSVLRKAINKTVAQGKTMLAAPSGNPQDAIMMPGPTMTQVGALQVDMDKKIQDLSQQFQATVNELRQSQMNITQSLQEHQQQTSQAQLDCSRRIETVEQTVHTLAAAVVTKSDLTTALREAMELQRSEIRQLLVKRSPEVTPTSAGDGKSQRVG